MDKLKKKKLFLVIGILLIMLIGGFIGYKSYLLFKYKVNKDEEGYKDFIEGLNNHNTVTVKSNGKQDETEYISTGGISIKNDFSGFIEHSENIPLTKRYVLYDENKKVIAFIMFGVNNYDKVEFIKETDLIDKNVSDKFFKKKDITNDIELFNYLVETKDKKLNIFSSIEEIKSTYVIYNVLSSYGMRKPMTYFEGDIVGYMSKYDDKTKEVHILGDNNEQSYYITFYGLDYFTDERILEVLENLVIN